MFEEATVSEILLNPDRINELKCEYIIIYDQKKDIENFQEMDKALDIMVKKGWKCIDVILLRGENTILAHALMEHIY